MGQVALFLLYVTIHLVFGAYVAPAWVLKENESPSPIITFFLVFPFLQTTSWASTTRSTVVRMRMSLVVEMKVSMIRTPC